MTTGIRYNSFVDAGGYGGSAIANVRALINAGVPVQWMPLHHDGRQASRWPESTLPPLFSQIANDRSLEDLPALWAATRAPVRHDTVILHSMPEGWDALMEPGKRNIGYAAWETDRIPAPWPHIINALSALWVPSAFNRAVFARDITIPIHVIPHVRRHVWAETTEAKQAALRTRWNLGPTRALFYCIGTWELRKNLHGLIRAFVDAFVDEWQDAQSVDVPTLIIKTSAEGCGPPPYYPSGATQTLAQEVVQRCTERWELKRTPAIHIVCDANLAGDDLDALRSIADCYVSLAHGEGFGLGAFEAACLGTPVLMPAWGGQREFLDQRWQGALPYHLQSVPIWPPDRPSYWPSQRWARVPHATAVQALQQAADRLPALRLNAQALQFDVLNRFSEPVIAAKMRAALGTP